MHQNKTMHIPEQFPEFEEKTAIITLAHASGTVYLAQKRVFQEIEQINTPETQYKYSDKEGFSRGFGGTNAGTEKHNKEHYERVFLNHFVDQLKRLQKEHQFERLVIFVPKDIKNITKDKIPGELKGKIIILVGNLIKNHPLDLVERFYKEIETE